MKKRILFVVLILFLPINVYAGRGCCSSHGGVCGCNSNGRQVCCDGSLSPSCRCTPPRVYGCTDQKANNYNPSANENDGSCTYTKYGCTDPTATNYDPTANTDDKSCKYIVLGCMDSKAQNYNKAANKDDGSCIYKSKNVNDKKEDLKDKEDDSSNSEINNNAGNTDETGNYNDTTGGLATLLSLIVGSIIAYFLLKADKNNKENDVIYCDHCGGKITCNMKYCRECGSFIKRYYGYCGTCGNKLSDNMIFCPICGTKAYGLDETNDKQEVTSETIPQITIEDEEKTVENYELPDINIFSKNEEIDNKKVSQEEKKKLVEKVERVLKSFNISAKVAEIKYSAINIIVEVELMKGEKISKLLSIKKELQMGLTAIGLEINTSTGKDNIVAIEIPNPNTKDVNIKEIFLRQKRKIKKMNIPLMFGVDANGEDSIIDLTDYSHLLISGTTGTGKTTLLNTIIMSILLTKKPDEVKLAIVDPKVVELSAYNGVPHLVCPVVSDPKGAVTFLKKIVNECEKRKKYIEVIGANSIEECNKYVSDLNERKPEEKMDKIPYMIVIIDDIFEMMRYSKNEVEQSINIITRYGKNVGVYLIISTQRSSSDIITTPIKNAMPYRISFAVHSAQESRIILETEGAEKINGEGIFIFKKAGSRDGNMIKGIYPVEEDILKVINYTKMQKKAHYDDVFMKLEEELEQDNIEMDYTEVEEDSLYDEIKGFVIKSQKASASLLQRKFKIGYNKASTMIDRLEEDGIIGPATGNSKPREVLFKYMHDDKN